jgi:predicted DNA-binding transcriptional regulator YafY
MINYQEEIKEMPVGLDRALLRILSFHPGREKAVGGSDLRSLAAVSGFRVQERTLREALKQLRRQGHLICSAPGENGGYYLAANMAEFQEFARMEFEGKIADMSETLNVMRKAAVQQFGEGVQMGLL